MNAFIRGLKMPRQESIIFYAFSIVVMFATVVFSETSSPAPEYEQGLRAYEDGEYDEAIEKWAPLAEAGDAEAQFRLGVLYQVTVALGTLEPEFGIKAFNLIHDAALQGHAEAQMELWLIIKKSYPDNPKLQAQAVEWLKLAANQGFANAQFELGVSFRDGVGVSQDIALATPWFRLAAEQGHADAQNNLAARYYHGDGVPQDFERAFFWFRNSAKQGNAIAQFNLGAMFNNGQWVSQDLSKAYMWMSLAADDANNLGTISADIILDPIPTVDQWRKTIAILETYMSERQIDQAKKMAERCINKKYSEC